MWDVQLIPADARTNFGSPEEVSGRILQIYPQLDFVARQHQFMKNEVDQFIDEWKTTHSEELTKSDSHWLERAVKQEQLTATIRREDYSVDIILPVNHDLVRSVYLVVHGADTAERCVRKMCKLLRAKAFDVGRQSDIDVENDPVGGLRRLREMCEEP
jgi:hypothetical protein